MCSRAEATEIGPQSGECSVVWKYSRFSRRDINQEEISATKETANLIQLPENTAQIAV